MDIAIVRRPAASLASHCELTFMDRTAIEVDALHHQHAEYCQALAEAGAKVIVLDAIEALPDSVFVEDAAVVLDELAILTCPGAASRQPEPDAIAASLRLQRDRMARIVAPGTLEGGDVLRVGRTLFVGLTTRTNRSGIEQLEALVAPFGYAVVAVDTPGSLHLKTACTALDDDTVLLNPAWLDIAPFHDFRILAVDPGEPFAANVLPVGDARIVNAAFPRTRSRVEAHCDAAGLRTIAVDIGEFGKAEAGLTCMSLVFEDGVRVE
ncbi:MAG: dimethylargininase [Xanthomonadaceae bacterium]|nr:dimethylargininase [Xanthomonadaceae bacterium]